MIRSLIKIPSNISWFLFCWRSRVWTVWSCFDMLTTTTHRSNFENSILPTVIRHHMRDYVSENLIQSRNMLFPFWKKIFYWIFRCYDKILLFYACVSSLVHSSSLSVGVVFVIFHLKSLIELLKIYNLFLICLEWALCPLQLHIYKCFLVNLIIFLIWLLCSKWIKWGRFWFWKFSCRKIVEAFKIPNWKFATWRR